MTKRRERGWTIDVFGTYLNGLLFPVRGRNPYFV